MKIVCDSCATKYSISDDKVQGKVFKIRCKKCSHIIVVRGTADAAAPAPAKPAAAPDGVWHLVVDGEQVGPLPDADIRGRLKKGEITHDTYIWKEGFADWLKISAVPEFADVAGGAAAPAAAAGEDPFAENERTVAHVPDQPLLQAATAPRAGGSNGGLFGTGNGTSDDPFAKPAAAAAGKDDDVFGSAPARGGGGGDLFASPAMAPAPFASPAPSAGGSDAGMQAAPMDGGRVSNLTAQRSENSVLFSLSNLQSLAMPAPPAGGGGAKPGFATTAGEGSGLIDIRSMAATTLGSAGPVFDAKKHADELPTFGAAFQPVAPVLLPSTSSGGMPKWMWGVIALCVLLVGGIAVMIVTIVNKKPEQVIVQAPPAPVAQPVAAAAVAAAPVAAAPPPAAKVGEEPPRAGGEEKSAEGGGGGTKRHGGGKKADKGGGDKGGGGKEEKPAAAAAKGKEAAAPKEEAAPAPAKKKGGDSLDDLLSGAIGGGGKKPRVSDDDPSEKPVKKVAEKPTAGPLPKEAVVAGMRGVMPKISTCYQQFKVPGMISVDVNIAPSGKVSSAKAGGKFAGTPTGTCVENAVRTASFPASSGLTTAYPFMLK